MTLNITRRFRWLTVCVIGGLLVSFTHADDARIYWTDARGIHRVNADGSDRQTIIPVVLSDPSGIAVDTAHGKIYWSDYWSSRILRANLDGTNIEEIVNGPEASWADDLALDPVHGRVYWVYPDTSPRIWSATLDGDDMKIVGRGILATLHLTIDVTGSYLYWTVRSKASGRIERTGLDGTSTTTLIRAVGMPFDIPRDPETNQYFTPAAIAVHHELGKIYWADWQGKIRSANLDGKGIQDAVTGIHAQESLAVDTVANKIYWVDVNAQKIQRANLDGTQIEDVIATPLSTLSRVTVVPQQGKLYWTAPGKIWRANLDGSDAQVLISTSVQRPDNVAIDPVDHKVYWTDRSMRSIGRANVDGTNVETIVSGLEMPAGLAIDLTERKLYWVDGGFADRIQRANLDGTEVEDVVSGGLLAPGSVVLDTTRGHLYWTDSSAYRIQRANLDGSDVTNLIAEGQGPIAVSVASEAGKLYWTTNIPRQIKRANLDGSEVEVLGAIQFAKLRDVLVDEQAGQIYWVASANPGKIQRANLDGTDVTDSVVDLAFPNSIAIAIERGQTGVAVRPRNRKPTLWGWVRRDALLPNYPNPFNPETWIPYALSTTSEVRIGIYTLDGGLVRELKLGIQAPGEYVSRSRAAYFDGRDALGNPLASGVYYYRIRAGDFTAVRKMVVRK